MKTILSGVPAQSVGAPRIDANPQVGQRALTSSARLHGLAWVSLLLACLGASWFSYQYFLVPQPKTFPPSWGDSQWVQAAESTTPVAYFRYATNLNVLPDGAFVTVAAEQVFQLYVNGMLIGSNAKDFVQGQFPQAYLFDVNPALNVGPNVIGVRVSNVDQRSPSVRVNFGLSWGNVISYRGTSTGWQATAQSTAVYPLFNANQRAWATAQFDASAWYPAQKVADPALAPMLTVDPRVYEHPLLAHWISAGAGSEAYFVRQVALPAGLDGVWLRIGTLARAEIFINGYALATWNGQVPVSQAYAAASYLSGVGSDEQYEAGQALGIYDITPYFHGGTNTIAIHVLAAGVKDAPGKLDYLISSVTPDILIERTHGAESTATWIAPDTGWHASTAPVDGWAQGSQAALAWPPAIEVGRAGLGRIFYLPGSNTPRSVETVSLTLTGELVFLSVAGVLSLWLLMSLVVMRRYFSSRRAALEMMSLAYLPAVAFLALLMVLTREPLIPHPFPCTPGWGIVVLVLVGVGYLLLWLTVQTPHRCARAGTSPRPYPIRLRPPLRRRVGAWACPRPGSNWLRLHWALLPIILVAIPLICYNLAYEPYWQDEWASLYAARGILAHGLPILQSGFLYAKGELYSYLLALSMLIFGDQGGAPRIISVVEYLLSLPLLYGIGCYFFDRRIALLATAMLALSPMALVWGRSVRMYEQAQFFTLLVAYLFYKATQQPGRTRLVYLAFICLIADYLSHEETFIIFPAILLGVLLSSRDAAHPIPTVLRQKHWYFAAILAMSAIGLQLFIVRVTHPPFLGTDQSQRPLIQFTTDNIPYYVKQLLFPAPIDPTLPWIALNSLLAIVGCILALRHSDARAKYCAIFLIVSFLTLVFAFTLTSDRYIYPLLPIFYLMGASALVIGLRSLETFARSHLVVPPGQNITVAPPSLRIMVAFVAVLFCASVLLAPMLPISGYNLFISQQAGLPYHRHYPDYDVAGIYVQSHMREGDVVITVSPSISVLYYVGHVDYLFSIDHALYLFERDGHIVDTPGDSIQALLSQQDFQAVLATHSRIWIISDNAQYQEAVNRRFVFPPDFHIVCEGYGSEVYFRGD